MMLRGRIAPKVMHANTWEDITHTHIHTHTHTNTHNIHSLILGKA